MSNIPISSLPLAISLDGSETVPIVQGGTTKQVATSLLWTSNPGNLPVGGLTGQALVKSSNLNYQTTWATVGGLGTVQQVNTGTGLTGGPITLIGTVSLASIANGNVLANVSGISAAPSATTPSAVLDVIGSTRGQILYRGASGWSALNAGSAGQILTTGGAGADPAWSAVGSGSVQSVGLSMPAIFSVSGSPVTTTGTLTASLANQNANLVWSGPSTGSAAAPTFRSLVGADLPNPAPTTLGGVKSYAAVSNQFLTQIGTDGSVTSAQPSFSNISGTIALSQLGTQSANTVLSGPTSGGSANPTFRSLVGADLPNPSASTLGGVQSLASVASRWINTISTSGVPSATQPAFSDISGSIAVAQLPAIANNTVLANTSGGSTQPVATAPTTILDIIGSTQGTILYRGASTWTTLAVGTDGQVLTTHGAAANPTWTTVTGTGTVTSVGSGTGLTGGPITTTGSLSLASISTGNVLANVSGISAAPSATTPSAVLDVIGSTQGQILYRGASNWTALAPGTSGQYLQTLGAGSTPQWAAAPITSINGQTGAIVSYYEPQGRITLSSGTPVMATTVSGSTTVYYTPYVGNIVPIYDGTNMVPTVVAEVSQATTDSTKSPAAVAASKVYDIFVWNDSGTIRATRGPAWSTSTSRGYTLTRTNGILLNTSSITNGPAALRGTYVGTIASNGSSTIDYIFGAAASGGTAAVFNVWNMYSRVTVGTSVGDTAAAHTYTSATVRSWNAGSGMAVSFVKGLDEDATDVNAQAQMITVAASNATAYLGIGLDSTSAFSVRSYQFAAGTNSTAGMPSIRTSWQSGIGAHTASLLEAGDGTNANSWGGPNSAVGAQQNFLVAFLRQ